MSDISMVEAKLPPGFRFHPKDEELVCDYLMKKLTHCDDCPLMIEVDLNKCEPWDIPEMACVGGKEWYIYSQRDRKYATGLRTNRATKSGYWKATGKDRAVLREGSLVGMRKTLVFYHGRAPRGRKTDWVMHEFRVEGHLPPKLSSLKEEWVLCRVFNKNREAITRPSMGSCFDGDDDDAGSSSSLPALMDSYTTFEQARPNLDEHDDQVPIFFHNQTNLNFPHITQLLEPNTLFGQPSIIPTPLYPDKNALTSVLDQLTRQESKAAGFEESPSLGEGRSSESYLSDVPGMFNMWTN